jgi:hypothetical protein
MRCLIISSSVLVFSCVTAGLGFDACWKSRLVSSSEFSGRCDETTSPTICHGFVATWDWLLSHQAHTHRRKHVTQAPSSSRQRQAEC